MTALRNSLRQAQLLGLLLLSLASSALGMAPSLLAQSAAPADLPSLRSRALEEAQSGKVDAAIRDYTAVLAQLPDWKAGWWNLGSLQYTADRFSEAKSTFSRIVQFAPAVGTAWALLGLSEFETKDLADSRTHLEKALSLGMDENPEVRRVATFQLALLLIRDGEFDRASALLLPTFAGGRVISPEVRFALGLILLHISLLPADVDPSHEALVSAAGDLASAGDRATEAFPGFLASYPDTPYAHYAYALLLVKAGRDLDALAQLRLETRISPASALPWTEISHIDQRLGKAAESRIDAGRAATLARSPATTPEQRLSHKYAPNSLNTSTDLDSSLWERVMQKFAAHQYAPAIADLKPLLHQHPENGTAWAVLGLSEFALQDLDDARIHLDRGQALGLNGSPASLREARYTLGVLLIRAGEFDRAAGILQSALMLNTQDTAIHDALGLCLLRKPLLPEQIADSDQDLVRSAGNTAALLQDSRYDEAFPLLESLLAKYPSTPFLHYAHGTALLALSQFDQAAEQMRAEIAISPGSQLPYLRLASIALRQHAPADAISPARKALDLAPNSPDAHYLLGRALLETGDYTAALHELEIAGELSPGSPEIHFHLARAYTRAKMRDAAATERAAFARLNQISEQQSTSAGRQTHAGPHEERDTVPAESASPTPKPN